MKYLEKIIKGRNKSSENIALRMLVLLNLERRFWLYDRFTAHSVPIEQPGFFYLFRLSYFRHIKIELDSEACRGPFLESPGNVSGP